MASVLRPVVATSSLILLLCAGCGGSGGGGSGQCKAACEQLASCASTLGVSLGKLLGDEDITDAASCATECTSSLTCDDKSAFLSCATSMSCTSESAVTSALEACMTTGGCGGGGGGDDEEVTALCTDLASCASALGVSMATLTGDENMTSSTCASEVESLDDGTCDLSGFVGCAADLTCGSVSAMKSGIHGCMSTYACGG